MSGLFLHTKIQVAFTCNLDGQLSNTSQLLLFKKNPMEEPK